MTFTGTLEEALSRRFDRRYCCLTNRGTTALTAAFHALGLPAGSPVVFPAAMCSIPVFSSLFAGLRPIFADVNLSDGNFDLESLDNVLQETRKPSAVVPIHMFGKPDAMCEIEAICQQHGSFLVEDCALSMGAASVGSFGRLSCFSFVRKMVPLEMGGAILTDESVLYQKAKEFVSRLPLKPRKEDEVARVVRAFHHLTAEVARGGWTQAHLLDRFIEPFRELLLIGTTETDWEGSILLDELERIPENLTARRERAQVYEDALKQDRIVPLEHGGSSFFAFPVRLRSIPVEGFLEFASRRDFEFKRIAYPDVHKVFAGGRNQPDELFKNAERMETEAVGMPVDETKSVSSYWQYGESFVKLLNEYLSEERPRFDSTGCLEMRMG